MSGRDRPFPSVYFCVLTGILASCTIHDRNNPFDPQSRFFNPPTVFTTPSLSASVFDPVLISVKSDPDVPVVKYLWSIDNGHLIDSTREPSLVATFSTPGTHHVQVVGVGEDGVPSTPATCVVSVSLDPPVLMPMRDTVVDIGDTVRLRVSVKDNGTISRFVWAPSTGGAADTTAVPVLARAFHAPGMIRFSVTATDDDRLTSAVVFITLRVVVSPPVVVASNDTTVASLDTVELSATGRDNGRVVSYQWEQRDRAGSLTTTTGRLRIAFTEPRDYIILVRARDEDGALSKPDSIRVTVKGNRRKLHLMGDTAVASGDSVTIRSLGIDPGPPVVLYKWEVLRLFSGSVVTSADSVRTAFTTLGEVVVRALAKDNAGVWCEPDTCRVNVKSR